CDQNLPRQLALGAEGTEIVPETQGKHGQATAENDPRLPNAAAGVAGDETDESQNGERQGQSQSAQAAGRSGMGVMRLMQLGVVGPSANNGNSRPAHGEADRTPKPNR